jgi:predicted nucleic-acid-binding protein
MIAVDTNVVVRLLTGDDVEQSAVARSVFKSDLIWIAKTVLLETAWVLRSLYKFDEHAIRIALTKLIGLPGVSVEDTPAVVTALKLAADGAEFADALHLASSLPDAVFVSFDKTFVKRAEAAGVLRVRVL